MNLNELLKNNSNLEDYLKEYGHDKKFIYQYYLQDSTRIMKNYYAYGDYLDLPSKISLVKSLITKVDNRIINFLLNDIINYKAIDEYEKDINGLLKYLIKLDKENIIDLDKISIKEDAYYLDPVYYVNKDINNIMHVAYVNDYDQIKQILNIAIKKNYLFTGKNEYFIRNKILAFPDLLIEFINKCKFDKSVLALLNESIGMLDKSDAYYVYNNINNKSLKNEIAVNLNFDNFDINTIVNNGKIYLFVNNLHTETIDFLYKAKDKKINQEIILVMDRIDMDFINEAYEIYGDKIRISPLINQEHKKVFEGNWDYPCYTYDEIKQSEETIDLYVKTVSTKVDKDGEIKELSPFEKFIAAYILTTKFSPYKEEDDEHKEYHTSRSIYEFIDKKTDKRIVCVGYVHLLREFLYRMGITETMRWDVHSKSEKERTKGNKDEDNHARMLIHLVDELYGIDGVYMSDPTWDEDFTRFKIDHMLMSRDEIRRVDPEFTEFDLRLHNIDQFADEYDIDDIEYLFNQPISKDTIIKGFLAVEHFLDKNQKMLHNHEYNILEYCDMAIRLGYSVTKENRDKVYNELSRMKISDITNLYPNLVSIFTSKLDYNISKEMAKTNEFCDLDIFYDEDSKKIVVNGYVYAKKTNMDAISSNYDVTMLARNIFEARLYELDDRLISEQMKDIIDSVKLFNSYIYNNPLEKDNKSVK